MRRAAAMIVAATMAVVPVRGDVAAQDAITPFSRAQPGGAMPEAWKRLTLRQLKPPEFSLVDDAGTTVARVRAEDAAGSLAQRLDADPAQRPILRWRWKVDRVLDKADLRRKDGDDYAARVYVSFDVPASALPLAVRAKMKLAKLLYGAELPAAAICYVWDNRYPPGTSAWNTHSDRLRMVVVESGAARSGQWVEASRDVDADFRAAFTDWKGPTPHISGVAIAADTDQTHEAVTAWFGDLRLEPRR